MSDHSIASTSTPHAESLVPPDANAAVPTPEEKTQVASKLHTAREKKDVADAAFKSGDLKDGASLKIAPVC